MKILMMVLISLLGISAALAAKPSLRGSPSSQERQNQQADKEDLTRLREKDLQSFKDKSLLVRLPDAAISVDPRLPEQYRWSRVWTRRFLIDNGLDFRHQFGRDWQVNSAVRTVEYQAQLGKRNGNAATHKNGKKQSSHLTGSTVDIAKIGMTKAELEWTRKRLLELERRGVIEATEEHRQLVFHVMVFRHYKKIPDKAPAKRI